MPLKKKEERIHESLEHLASSNVLLNLLRIRDKLIADLFHFSTIRKNSNRVEDIRARFRHDSKISLTRSKKKEEIAKVKYENIKGGYDMSFNV